MQQTTRALPAFVQPLFAGLEHHLAIEAAATAAAPSHFFAPSLPLASEPEASATDLPHSAILWVHHRVFIGGAPTPTRVTWVRDLLAATIAPAARARGDYAFGLYYTRAWHSHLDALLPDLPHSALDRCYFVAEGLDLLPALRAQPPAGLRLEPVTAALLARSELTNHARLTEELCSERPTVDDFLARSFGVCLLDGDTLAGWCLSEYNSGPKCEVGIEVIEEYQRRGLGAFMTQALCAEAARRGIQQVGWHCLAQNAASAATARRAGLRLAIEYPSAVVWLQPPLP